MVHVAAYVHSSRCNGAVGIASTLLTARVQLRMKCCLFIREHPRSTQGSAEQVATPQRGNYSIMHSNVSTVSAAPCFCCFIAADLLEALPQAPGRQRRSAELLERLQQEAVLPPRDAQQGLAAMERLLEHPAAEQLPADSVAALLRACLQHRLPGSIVEQLCGSPGAAQLKQATVLELLQAVIRSDSAVVHKLLAMKQAQELPKHKVLQLLQLVLACKEGDLPTSAALHALLALPSLKQLQMKQLSC